MNATNDSTGLRGDISVTLGHLRRVLRDRYWQIRAGKKANGPVVDRASLPAEGSVVVVDGIKMKIDPLMSPFNIHKLTEGRHTIHERSLLSAHLRQGDRVLELGGGIGMVAIHCARAIGSEDVHSFEGNPRMEELIRANYALNDVSPSLYMRVLGPADGEVTFYLAERFSHSAMTDNTGQSTPVQVPMEAYDTARKRIKPTVLVIDIQGAEIAFFDFADLRGVRMILVEFHPPVTGLRPILATRRKLRRLGFVEASRSGQSSVFLRDG